MLRTSSHRILVLAILFVLASIAPAFAQPKPGQSKQTPTRNRKSNGPLQQIKDDPNLPRVLLIGDSISIGYTLPVRSMLKGQANVHRPAANCGPTIRGLEQIDKWLGDQQWDVIHFNWGLHDLKYMGPKGQNLADPKAADSKQQVPPEAYEKNLRKLVERLKKTKATLIWCSTTPVPEGAKGRVLGDSKKYNEIAARVMKDNDVVVHDLYAFAHEHLDKIQQKANVHFTTKGSEALAGQVTKVIRKALETR